MSAQISLPLKYEVLSTAHQDVTCERGKQIAEISFGGLNRKTWKYEKVFSFGPAVSDTAKLSFTLSNEEARDRVILKFVIHKIQESNTPRMGYQIELENGSDLAARGLMVVITPWDLSKYLIGKNNIFMEAIS